MGLVVRVRNQEADALVLEGRPARLCDAGQVHVQAGEDNRQRGEDKEKVHGRERMRFCTIGVLLGRARSCRGFVVSSDRSR